MPTDDLEPGDVVWVTFDPVRGREQAGHRPALVVASAQYLRSFPSLAMVVPLTTVDRGWTSHIPVLGPSGLDRASFAITEQLARVDRGRITARSGRCDIPTLRSITEWLHDFIAR